MQDYIVLDTDMTAMLGNLMITKMLFVLYQNQ